MYDTNLSRGLKQMSKELLLEIFQTLSGAVDFSNTFKYFHPIFAIY